MDDSDAEILVQVQQIITTIRKNVTVRYISTRQGNSSSFVLRLGSSNLGTDAIPRLESLDSNLGTKLSNIDDNHESFPGTNSDDFICQM